MDRFIESIRLEHRTLQNLEWHNKRFNETRLKMFGLNDPADLGTMIAVPDSIDESIYKCRLVYDKTTFLVDFQPYQPRMIRSLKLVEAPDLKYAMKFENRDELNRLLEKKNEADDILVTQHGFITDTSFSNVVFFNGRDWFTPTTYLLNGTRRQSMLAEGTIREAPIRISDIKQFKEVRLMNAMLDFRVLESVEIML